MAYSDIEERITTLNAIAMDALGRASAHMSFMRTYYGVNNITPPSSGNLILDDYTLKELVRPVPPVFVPFNEKAPDPYNVPNGGSFAGGLSDPPVFQSSSRLAFSEANASWLSVETKEAIKKLFAETGLEVVEIDIWEKGIEKGRQALYDAEDQAIASSSDDGFSMPNDIIDRDIEQINRQFDDARLLSNGEITLKHLDLAQKNAQFGINSGLDGEALLWNYFSNIASRALQAAKAVAGLGLERFNTSVLGYNAYLNAKKEGIRGAVEIEESVMSAYKDSLEIKSAELGAFVSNLSSLFSGYRSLISAYKSETRALTSIVETKLSWRKVKYRENIANLRASLETAIAQMDTGVSLSGINASVDAASAAYLVNFLSATLGSLQVLVRESTEEETIEEASE